MGFDVSHITSGFDLGKILSDEKHYESFICVICTNLVSLDAVVTSRCSHPFCRRCLESWALQCNLRQSTVSCPVCKGDLSSDPSVECMEFGTLQVAARPMSEAQPLAFRVLSLVQIKFVDEDNVCKWTGDYGKFLAYMQNQSEQSGSDHALRKSKKRGESLDPPPQGNEDESAQRSQRGDEPPESPRRYLSSNVLTESLLENRNGYISNVDTGESNDDTFGETTLADTNDDTHGESNGNASESPRWKHAGPQNGENQGEKTSPQRDVAPNMIMRKKSGIPHQHLTQKDVSRSTSEDGNTFESFDVSEGNSAFVDGEEASEGSLDMVARERLAKSKRSSDFGTSINSMAFWGDSNVNFMQTLTEGTSEQADDANTIVEVDLELDESTTRTDEEIRVKQIIERTQKLKKQANAKFNKGDFSAARVLYTEGINIMGSFRPTGDEERELMSHMHSNRAVTFFREKNFQVCINDCEKAIEFDPTYDKNWVRLWRALMALGEVDKAHAVIEKATTSVPDSSRVAEEYHRSLLDRELLAKGKSYVKQGNHQIAKDLISEPCKNTSNLRLLCLAARIEVSLGLAEAAMEQVNKALRLNPKFPEALELHGHALFLMGDTEKAAQVLYESYNLDSESYYTKATLTKCQRIHTSLSQARSAAKRGRHEESLKNLCNAMNDCEELPNTCPLYVSLYCERAEAFLRNKKFLEALKDCQEIFTVDKEHAKAWVIRSEVLISLGKIGDAKKELTRIRKTWGFGISAIDDQYRKVDYEYRVSRADQDLVQFVKELESGICERLTPIDADNMHASERRSSRKHAKPAAPRRKPTNYEMSPRPHDNESSPRPVEDSSLRSKRRDRQNRRRSDRPRDDVSVAKSRREKGHESRSRGSDDRSVVSKVRQKRRDDDKSRRKSDEASVYSERRAKPRRNDDGVSVATDRRRSSRKDDDTASVSTDRRKSRARRQDDTSTVASGKRRSGRRDSAESSTTAGTSRKERIDEKVNRIKNPRSKP